MNQPTARVLQFFSTRVWVLVLGVALVVVGALVQHGKGPADIYVRPLLVVAGLSTVALGWRRSSFWYAASGSLVAAGCAARIVDLAWFTVENWDKSSRSGLYGVVSWVALGVACMLGWRGTIASMVGERS